MIASVIGLGHIGLITALGLAKLGNTVYGYDSNQTLKRKLKQGTLPYSEDGVQDALLEHNNRSFHVTDTLDQITTFCSCYFFCVGTPAGENGILDLSELKFAIRDVAAAIHMPGTYLFIIRSTLYPGASRSELLPLIDEYQTGDIKIQLTVNPEFLRESSAWKDFCGAKRTLIGADDPEAAKTTAALYEALHSEISVVSIETAEFSKMLSNCMLASFISFSNEMQAVATAVGRISVRDSFSFIQSDERWKNGEMAGYLFPGCGYGGYCLPKDTKAMLQIAEAHGVKTALLKSAVAINDNMPMQIASIIAKRVEKAETVGIYGLSFKPGTDDVRESPAEKIIKCLNEMGYTSILGFDPLANSRFQASTPSLIRSDVIVNLHKNKEIARRLGNLQKTVLDFRYN